MHFHHRHDIEGCTNDHTGDWPDWAIAILATIDRRDLQLMSAVQADLDAATTVITELVAKVSDLEAQVAAASPSLDSSALNAEVAAAQAVVNPAPTPPADPTPAPAPADQPAAPADQPAAPVDPNAPAAGIPSVPLA